MSRTTTVVIGGIIYVCPPMPFYCLDLAWPHIQRLGEMGRLGSALRGAQLQKRNAISDAENAAADVDIATVSAMIAEKGADLIGQTREALHVIVAALALDQNPPSYDKLAKTLRQDEINGLHTTVSELMDLSGLTGDSPGEAVATQPDHLNGLATSRN